MLWKRWEKWRGRGGGEKGGGGKGGDGWVRRPVRMSAGDRKVVFVASFCMCIPYVVVLYMSHKKDEVLTCDATNIVMSKRFAKKKSEKNRL